MSMTPISPVRRVITRTCYALALLCLAAGVFLFAVSFNDNYWVYTIFTSIFLVIAGNAISHPRPPETSAEKEDD